jgi:AcrR family transcriptional regulator
MDETLRPSARGESTRDALLDAATVIFARQGFEPANLRSIAQAAGVNPALIGYHFGNKEGLYLAVFERWVAQMREVFTPVWAEIDRVMAEPAPAGLPGAEDPCQELLLGMIDRMVLSFVQEHSAWGELMVREQQFPTAAFEVLFKGIIGPKMRAFTALIQRLRGPEDPGKSRLIGAMIASQALIFRGARIPLMRMMDWGGIGEQELDTIRALVRRNTLLLVHGD